MILSRQKSVIYLHVFYFFLAGTCKDPGSLENGRILGKDYSYDSSITFKCNFGYDLRGPASSTCQKGVWNGGIPECKSKL